jgi:ribonuclease HI
MINIYIDGSCSNNGYKTAKAGYAVYFGENNPKNEYNVVKGKQTNNTGEITAFIRAIELSQDDIEGGVKINIYTDSEYVIKCVTTYGDKLKLCNWQSRKGKVIPNLELVRKAYELYNEFKDKIKIYHVKAHTDGDDEQSKGNREADRLANLAIGCTKCPIIKHYINVNYDRKDMIKSLGAKWDLKEKKWYYTDDLPECSKQSINQIELEYINTKELVPIIEESVENTKKNYINISFKNKDNAKKLGARWDPSLKSWYYLSNLSISNIEKLRKLEG